MKICIKMWMKTCFHSHFDAIFHQFLLWAIKATNILRALETHHFTFTVSSTLLIWGCFLYHFLSSCKMDHDLPWFRFAQAVHSDVISTLVFFNNCHLTNVNFIQFETRHLYVVARSFNKWKNTKVFRNNVLLHSHSQRFFANVSLKFSNINNRRVTSAHVGILLSFMQLIEEYLLAIKIVWLFLILWI